MKISFVIPAHNEEARIGACLESVLRELERTPCDAEVVVVDNVSSDRTAEVAKSYPGVRVVHEPKKGLPQARHAGFGATQGELVANIDADTIVPRLWLDTVLQEFEKNPELVALSGPYIYHDLPLLHRGGIRVFYAGGYLMHLLNHHVLGVGAMLQGGNFVIRRDAMERAGGFDTSISFYGEDTDVARRLSKIGRVKWTFRLPMYTSGRRLAHEGFLRMGTRYAINFFSTTFRGRPATDAYIDVR